MRSFLSALLVLFRFKSLPVILLIRRRLLDTRRFNTFNQYKRKKTSKGSSPSFFGKDSLKVRKLNFNPINEYEDDAEDNTLELLNSELQTDISTVEEVEQENKNMLTFELNQYEQPLGFITIDSLSSLAEIKQDTKKIFVCGNESVLNSFFQKVSGFRLSHLVIITPDFSPYTSTVVQLVKNDLKYLRVEAGVIDYPEFFVRDLHFYSSLETLEISAKRYKEGYYEDRNKRAWLTKLSDYSKVKSSIDEKCNEIIKLNKEVEAFLSNELPKFKQKLIELSISEEGSLTDLNTQQIKFALSMVEKKDEFDRLNSFYSARFHNHLREKNSTFSRISQLVYEWDIENIVSSDNNLEKFDKIRLLLSNFDINQRFRYNRRLIDIAVDSSAIKMVKALISLNTDLVCVYESAAIPDRLEASKIYRNLNSFPFKKVIQNYNNKELREIFFANEEALYDGLAWLICANELRYFKEIYNPSTVNLNKSIEKGAFTGFTLFQLIIYYARTEFFLELQKQCPLDALVALANQFFPDKQFFLYAGWSVLATIFHQGQYDELMILCPLQVNLNEYCLKNNGNFDSVKLLLYGAASVKEKESSILENYRKCFNYLLKSKCIEINLENLMLEDTSNGQLPLLDFIVHNEIFSVIPEYIGWTQNNLQKKVYIKRANGEVNALQLAVIINNEETIRSIFNLYNTNDLLGVTSEALPNLEEINLFHYSIVFHNYNLFRKFISWDNCPINSPFPEHHSQYPSWLPLQVIMLNQFVSSSPLNQFLGLLLTRLDLDITKIFNERGKPHHLGNYYPTSAIFFADNPIKDSDLAFNILSGCLEAFLPLLDKLTGRTKRNILDQALFYAIVHHERRTGYDHSEHIKTLVKHGANPYQCYGPEGNRIIDLAIEKGLSSLFPEYIKDYKATLAKQATIFSGNVRESELSQFSRGELYVNEDYYSVVSLIRNEKCGNTEHVFIVIEKIIKGHSIMYFIDFVKDKVKIDKGKIRCQRFEDKIIDFLLFKCKLPMMEIKDTNDLVCQSWQITNEACDKLLANIELDRAKEIDYLVVGNRSLFAQSSNKKGHNCYTWAREKLCSIESPKIEQALKPSLEEWIGTLPSLKDRPWYKNRLLLYSASAVAFTSFAITTGMKLYNNYNNDSTFRPTLNF